MDERAVLPGQTHGLAAMLIDEADDFLIELAQHHLHYVHHSVVRYAHSLPELAFDAHFSQEVANLRAAAMHDDGIHSHELEHHDIAREAGFERRLGHGIAAVFDDDRLVVKAANIG